MTQEEFIKYLIDILIYSDEFKINKLNNQEFYKDDKLYFEYDSKNDYLFCSYDNVWNIFEDKYGLNYQEIKDLLKDMLVGSFNMSETTPLLINRVHS